MKKKKMWIFYLIHNEDIYAYTDDISYAEEFIKTRNMNKFHMEKNKLSREEYNDLYENYMNNQLVMFEGTTKLKKSYKKCEFSIPLTRKEQIECRRRSSVYIHECLLKNVWTDYKLFKDKYKSALNSLFYDILHEYLKGNNTYDDYLNVKKICPDDMYILLECFGKLFD